MDWTPSLQQEFFRRLKQNQLAEGGFPYYPGGKPAVEPTLHAILALTEIKENPDGQLAWQWVLKQQNPDGSIGVGPHAPKEGLWLTAHFLLASAHLSDPAAGSRAAPFLLAFCSKGGGREDYVDQDNALIGWPWTKDTFGWVEPTAWALMALHKVGMGNSPRAIEGRKLLLDRKIPSGGWNYGNRVVLASELLPFVDTTALALMALHGYVSLDQVASSLDLLERILASSETPYSLALIAMTLRLYGRPVNRVQSVLLDQMSTQAPEVTNVAHWSLGLMSFSERNPLLP